MKTKSIERPIKRTDFLFPKNIIEQIRDLSGGYPYFIQFICHEYFELVIMSSKQKHEIPVEALFAKLDAEFFTGRWHQASDRQQDLLTLVASMTGSSPEFGIKEITEIPDQARKKIQPFRKGDVAQMLPKLVDLGLVYRSSHGKYVFALPLFVDFIRRIRKNNKAE